MAQRRWTSSHSCPLQATLMAAVRGRGSFSARLMPPGRAHWPSCRSNWTMQGPSQTPAKQVRASTDTLGATMSAWMPAIDMACCLPVCCSGLHGSRKAGGGPLQMSYHVCQKHTPGHGGRRAFLSLAGDVRLLPAARLLDTNMQHADQLHLFTKFGESPKIVKRHATWDG